MKLVIDNGHWATKNNDMIFGNVVWLMNEKDAFTYHLIDDNHEEIKLDKPITDYIVLERYDLCSRT
jgi:hypothetical protein